MASSSSTILSSPLLLLVLTFLTIIPFHESRHDQGQSYVQAEHAITQPRSIHELLPKFGLPKGIIPDSVSTYKFDHETGELEVELIDQPCYIQLDNYVISYEKRVTGLLKLGSITKVKGVRMKHVVFWVDVDEIKVDLPPHNLVYFQVGFVNRKLDVALFQSLYSCSPSSKKKRVFTVLPSWDLEARGNVIRVEDSVMLYNVVVEV